MERHQYEAEAFGSEHDNTPIGFLAPEGDKSNGQRHRNKSFQVSPNNLSKSYSDAG